MKKRVLLVGDDGSDRESLRKVLQDAGYEVAAATGGGEGALPCESGQCDLLLLDLNLPNQNGWDVFESLTRRQPWIPVIILAGMPDQYRTALAAGVSALFEKPVEVPSLLATMSALLREPNAVQRRTDSDNARYESPENFGCRFRQLQCFGGRFGEVRRMRTRRSIQRRWSITRL